ncbi:hypothetical protein BH11ARM2_BH11ARM2_39620 [soil metagenome]
MIRSTHTWRGFRTTSVYATRAEVFEILGEWSADQHHGWSALLIGPIALVRGEGYRGKQEPRQLPLWEDGQYVLSERVVESLGGWDAYEEAHFRIQIIRNDLPEATGRMASKVGGVKTMGYDGLPMLEIPSLSGSSITYPVVISQTAIGGWKTARQAPAFLAYRTAFCEIRRMLRSRATLFRRRSHAWAVSVSTRNATPGFRALLQARPESGDVVIEDLPNFAKTTWYSSEGILKPEDFLE